MLRVPSWRALVGALGPLILASCGGEHSPAPLPPLGPPPAPAAALAAAITAAEQQSLAALPAGQGRDLVATNCLICHGAAMIEQQRKDTGAWNRTVTQMVAWGAPLPAAQKPMLIRYLAKHYQVRTGGLEPPRP